MKVWHFGILFPKYDILVFFCFKRWQIKKNPHNVQIRIMQHINKPLQKLCSMSNSYVISVDKFVMGKTIKYHPTCPLVFLKTMINFPFVKDEYAGRLCIYNEPKGLYSFLPSAQEVVGSPRRLSYRYTRSNISDMQPVWQLLFHRVGYIFRKMWIHLPLKEFEIRVLDQLTVFPSLLGLSAGI
jgi:hypothetical protein